MAKMKLAATLVLCMTVATGMLGATSVEAASHKHVKHAKHKKHTPAHATKTHKTIKKAALEDPDNLTLQSASVLVQDQSTGAVLFEKNSDAVLPIASITKLMTAMVVLDAKQSLEDTVSVSDADVDLLRGSRSRLQVGTHLSRENMLRLALMSSENRAASSLARSHVGGMPAFVAAMNRKAETLGLKDTRFSDATGLNAANVSSARDLTKMVSAASQYPLIRELSTTPEYLVNVNGRVQTFHNTNTLVRNANSGWEIGLSKTGYINESGKCLVMQAWLGNKPIVIVLLDSIGKLTRIGDAQRIKRWIESAGAANLNRPSASAIQHPAS